METKVHKVRFYNPTPQAINCVSLNKTLHWVALARADASIEIWDIKKAPYMVTFIPGVMDGSVEALGWVHDRLLSTGLTGGLVEWDLSKLSQKTNVLLTGSSAWCLDVDSGNKVVAVGTEQGYVNLYSVEDNNIIYKKLFDKQEGRILSCKFNKEGNVLVTGSINSIRTWNVETGHATNKLTVTCRGTKEVLVWSVWLMADSVIVSGDSYGRLTFWDGDLGEQIETFTTHKADILSLTVSEDERDIYCAGVDPVISHFVKVDKGKGAKDTQWVKAVQRNIHEHDVKALLLCDQTLISAGVDGYLTFSSFPPKWVMRLPPMVPLPRTFVCPTKKLLMLRYSNRLEIWKLGSYMMNNRGEAKYTKNFDIDHDTPKHNGVKENENHMELEPDSTVTAVNGNHHAKRLELISQPQLYSTIETKKGKQIQCCDMSADGQFIVYATDSDFRLLKLETDEDHEDSETNVSLSKLSISGISSPVQRVAFSEHCKVMVVAHCAGLAVLRVDSDAGATVVQAIDVHKYLKSKTITHLLVTRKLSQSGSTYIIVADALGAIVVFVEKKDKKKFSHYVTLPAYQCVPTAMVEDVKRETLIIAYSDHTVIEYDLVENRFTSWPGPLPRQQNWFARRPAITCITIHPARDAVIFASETSVWVLDRDLNNSVEEPHAKRKPHKKQSCGVKIWPMKYLGGFHWTSSDEAVLVQTLPEHIVSQLPAPVRLNRWHVRPDRF